MKLPPINYYKAILLSGWLLSTSSIKTLSCSVVRRGLPERINVMAEPSEPVVITFGDLFEPGALTRSQKIPCDDDLGDELTITAPARLDASTHLMPPLYDGSAHPMPQRWKAHEELPVLNSGIADSMAEPSHSQSIFVHPVTSLHQSVAQQRLKLQTDIQASKRPPDIPLTAKFLNLSRRPRRLAGQVSSSESPTHFSIQPDAPAEPFPSDHSRKRRFFWPSQLLESRVTFGDPPDPQQLSVERLEIFHESQGTEKDPLALSISPPLIRTPSSYPANSLQGKAPVEPFSTEQSRKIQFSWPTQPLGSQVIPDNLPNLGWQSTEEGKASSNSQVTEKAALALSLSPPLIRTPPSHSAQLSEVNRNYHETLEDDLHLPSIRQAKKKKSKGSQPGCEAQIAATSDKTHDLPAQGSHFLRSWDQIDRRGAKVMMGIDDARFRILDGPKPAKSWPVDLKLTNHYSAKFQHNIRFINVSSSRDVCLHRYLNGMIGIFRPPIAAGCIPALMFLREYDGNRHCKADLTTCFNNLTRWLLQLHYFLLRYHWEIHDLRTLRRIQSKLLDWVWNQIFESEDGKRLLGPVEVVPKEDDFNEAQRKIAYYFYFVTNSRVQQNPKMTGTIEQDVAMSLIGIFYKNLLKEAWEVMGSDDHKYWSIMDSVIKKYSQNRLQRPN